MPTPEEEQPRLLLWWMTHNMKISMREALAQVKLLNAANLRSIKQIAEADRAKVEAALKDSEAALNLQASCRAAVNRGEPFVPRRGTQWAVDPLPERHRVVPSEAHEKLLELPLCMDEERMAQAVIETNSAQLLLAFAVELMRHTMPAQPLSSRLSLGFAVARADARSRAISLGLAKGPSADDEGWGRGWPRARVLGRDIAVLVRGSFWHIHESESWYMAGEQKLEGTHEVVGGQEAAAVSADSSTSETQARTTAQTPPAAVFGPRAKPVWRTSHPLSLQGLTFVVRSTDIRHPSQCRLLVQRLLNDDPSLAMAAHIAWAYRLGPLPDRAGTGRRICEESFDGGVPGRGELILRILRRGGTVNQLVVLTRWVGNTVQVGPRWPLMQLRGIPLWALDLEAGRNRTNATKAAIARGYESGTRQKPISSLVGMDVHRPELARACLLNSFASAQVEDEKGGSTAPGADKGPKAREEEKRENLGLLLGALRIVFDSWARDLGIAELDRRAWTWYLAVRPDVESGQASWDAKGKIKLADVLELRKPPANTQHGGRGDAV